MRIEKPKTNNKREKQKFIPDKNNIVIVMKNEYAIAEKGINFERARLKKSHRNDNNSMPEITSFAFMCVLGVGCCAFIYFIELEMGIEILFS